MAYDYTSYGQTEAATAGSGDQAAGDNPFTYTGAYELDNGDKALGHRYLSQRTHRFTQQDPSRQEDNLYSYAACDHQQHRPQRTQRSLCGWQPCIGWFGILGPGKRLESTRLDCCKFECGPGSDVHGLFNLAVCNKIIVNSRKPNNNGRCNGDYHSIDWPCASLGGVCLRPHF
ncbi:RHS repeat-associated core domain-containing protein [Streptomonospora salina]|uniref:RHS repeat-associated core domain-containing protein n=1 Tax=Streptomonospora salina TaxID=104205 RepID=UPI00162171DB